MSRYGVDIYGKGYYGVGTLTLVDFDASPFTARPTNYGEITLRWVVPTGDWSSIRLVRNRYGFPLTSDDGDVILETTKLNAPNYYVDDGEFPSKAGLQPGIDYFYSLFVLKVSDGFWAKAGNAFAVSPQKVATHTNFFNSLPVVYQTNSFKTLTSSADNGDLESFLEIFETYFNFMKSYASLSLKMYDPTIIHYPALAAMMNQFGSKLEPELGVQQSRIFLRNLMLLNKTKGSLQGLKDFIKAFTGWEIKVTPTVNIMLSYNDSSFEESVGNWASIANANLSVATSSTVTPYAEASLPSEFPNKQAGSLKLKAVAAGDVEIACGLSNPITNGIPVQANTPYTFSIYTRAATTGRTVAIDVRWYNRKGVEISRAGEVTAPNATTGWTRRIWLTSTSPDDVYFAVPYIRVQGAAINEVHYFDAGQFEVSSSGPTGFQEARGVNISLLANRVNLLENPCGEINLTPWIGTNATVARTTDFFEDATGSGHSIRIDPTTNGSVSLKYDDYVSITGGEWYTASGYIRTGYTGSYSGDRFGGYKFNWYDQSKVLISSTTAPNNLLTEYYLASSIYRTDGTLHIKSQTLTSLVPGNQIRLYGFDGTYSQLTGIDGTYTVTAVVGTEIQMVSSGNNISTITRDISLTNGQWLIQDLKLDFIQLGNSAIAPANAFYVKPELVWNNAQVGQSIWVDSQMLEQSTNVKSYFDGSTGVSDPTDLLWEGDMMLSRSHYYKNRIAVERRLVRELPNYLYINQWFALYFANSYIR